MMNNIKEKAGDDMISAKIANEQTTKNKDTILKRELFEIESKIKEAIKCGKYECVLDFPVSKDALEILKECDYEIRNVNQYNITYTSIRW